MYFFITAGTGGLRYELCFRSSKLTEQAAKLGHEILHRIKVKVNGLENKFYGTARPILPHPWECQVRRK